MSMINLIRIPSRGSFKIDLRNVLRFGWYAEGQILISATGFEGFTKPVQRIGGFSNVFALNFDAASNRIVEEN